MSISDLCPLDRYVPAVVTWNRILLIAWLMLLIDNNKPGIRQRRKHCRPGPDNDISLACSYRLPLRVSLCRRQAGMHHRDPLEASAEPLDSLCRQSDLRQKYNSTSPCPHYPLDRPYINFRLAAIRDTIENTNTEIS